MMTTSVSSLFGDLDVQVTPDAPIGPQTWYSVGGKADLLVSPRSVEALAMLVKRARRSNIALRVMGSGANLLVGDEGVGGIVIKLDHPSFREIKYNPDGDIDRMRAMAGADMARTLMDAARRGLAESRCAVDEVALQVVEQLQRRVVGRVERRDRSLDADVLIGR